MTRWRRERKRVSQVALEDSEVPMVEGQVARVHRRARQQLEEMGWDIPGFLPPVAAARWVAERAATEVSGLESLAWLHYHVRYGIREDADVLADRYPQWDRFQAARDRLDPVRRFTNDYLDRVLGP